MRRRSATLAQGLSKLTTSSNSKGAGGMRWLIAIAGIAAFVGVAFGLDVLLMQIDRNNQGEYIDTATGALDYHYALLMFIPWFLISAIVTASVLSLVLVLARWHCTRLRDLAIPQVNLIAWSLTGPRPASASARSPPAPTRRPTAPSGSSGPGAPAPRPGAPRYPRRGGSLRASHRPR